jgi:rubrerythrin
MSAEELAAVLEAIRSSEKEQALFYRGLAARAEEVGDVELAQRFHGLHADEQHHLSRLTARLLELGSRPRNLDHVVPIETPLDGWEVVVRERENAEVALYRAILGHELDEETRDLIDEILAVESRHVTELGGKWTMA